MARNKVESYVNEHNQSLSWDNHAKFFHKFIEGIPFPYAGVTDISRNFLPFMCVMALKVMNKLSILKGEDHKELIEYIYQSQVPDHFIMGGFQGGTATDINNEDLNPVSLAMTYTSLLALKTLGDDFSKVNKDKILNNLHRYQDTDGSFRNSLLEESDMRFTSCACNIVYLLNGDFNSCFDVQALVRYIKSCQTYEGGFSTKPGLEAHGGYTFCALLSLELCGDGISKVLSKSEIDQVLRFLVNRQVQGLTGRTNKDEDSCYAYWIGGSLKLLGRYELIDQRALRQFMSRCEDKHGGFSKNPQMPRDIMHGYFSTAGLFMHELDPKLLFSRPDASSNEVG